MGMFVELFLLVRPATMPAKVTEKDQKKKRMQLYAVQYKTKPRRLTKCAMPTHAPKQPKLKVCKAK